MYRPHHMAVLALLGLTISACVEDTSPSRSSAFDAAGGRIGGGTAQSSLSEGVADLGASKSSASRSLGTDRFLDAQLLADGSARAEVIEVGDGVVEMNLLNASIEAAAAAVLGDALGRPYVVAEGLEGQITLQTTGPVEKAVLLDLFAQALEASGAAIETSGVTLRVVSRRAGRQLQSSSGRIDVDGAIVVAPLRFVSATQMAGLLREIVGPDLDIAVDDRRNHLLLSGSRQDLLASVEALNVFDVNVLRGKSTALVPLRAAEPEAVGAELAAIFETGPGGSLEGVLEFLPNPRLKSILVVSKRASYIAEAERWIRELDQTAGTSRSYTRTYLLRNRDPELIAPILTEALGGIAPSEATEGDASRPPAPGEGIQVIPDTGRNTLLVRALRAEHEEIERIIHELDTTPAQVLLEATIAEVQLNDDLDLGVRWFFESGDFSASFSDLASGAVSSVFPGFSAVFAGTDTRIALSALASVTDIKVVSSPTLMVLNNQEAELRIGDQVPVAVRSSQSTEDNDARVVTTIEYRDTGIILTVRPRIGRSGQVTLEISQEVSDVTETTTSGIDSPTIQQRNIRTNVVVANGETLALGGLIQERDTKTNTKVPILGDIPGVGAVFRAKRDAVARSELLILIRPRVLVSAEDARRATAYWRGKLGGADQILQDGLAPGHHRLGDLLR